MATKKLFLFEITQTTDMIIVAEDERQAREIARDYADDAMNDAAPGVDATFSCEVIGDKDLRLTGWDRHAIPYGADDDMTVGEYLDDMVEERKARELADRQLPLLPGDKKP